MPRRPFMADHPARGRRWSGRLAAAAAGGIPLPAFPEPGWHALAFVGLVPLVLVIRAAPSAREAGWRGWFGGAGYLLAVHYWLAPKVHVFLPVVGLLVGLLLVPWGWAVHRTLAGRVTGRRLAAGALVLPSAWLLAEYARSWEELGGPWGLLGASQWNSLRVLALAAVGGVWLVSFLLVAVNVLVVGVLVAAGTGVRIVAVLVAVGAVGSTIAFAPAATRAPSEQRMTVGGVQPGIIQDGAERLAAGQRHTRAFGGDTTEVVVWAESAVAYNLQEQPSRRQELVDLAAATGVPLLVNTDARTSEGAILKASVLVTADGVAARYDKMRLVPFGEYVPLRPVLGWLTEFTEAAPEDRGRGTALEVFDVDGRLVGPVVCFELAFPDLARHLASRGADVIVAQSNTGTFQHSWAPEQQATLAAVRAVESGRPVVHAALSGVSAVFDSEGRRLGWVPSGFTGPYVFDVPLSDGMTPYVRLGDWVPALAVLVVLVGAAVSVVRRPRMDPWAR